jgi:MFS transporter, Spinster family, sphingosine-1-phosphate transporter
MICAPLFARLAEGRNRWRVIAVGVILWSAATALSGAATSYPLLALARVLVGVGEATYGPLAPAILCDHFPPSRRSFVLGLFSAAVPIGSALGYLFAGLVIKAHLTWHHAFFIVAPPGAVVGFFCLFLSDVPSRGLSGGSEGDVAARTRTTSAAAARVHLKEYVALAKVPSYVLVVGGGVAMTFALGAIAFWVPSYIVWRKAASLEDANSIFSPIIVVTGFLSSLVGERHYFIISALFIRRRAPSMRRKHPHPSSRLYIPIRFIL